MYRKTLLLDLLFDLFREFPRNLRVIFHEGISALMVHRAVTKLQTRHWNFVSFWPKTGKKKAYTTTTERRSFGIRFWPQKTFQGGGWYKEPYETKETISTTEILPLWPTFLSANRSSSLDQGGVWSLFPNGGLLLPDVNLLLEQWGNSIRNKRKAIHGRFVDVVIVVGRAIL